MGESIGNKNLDIPTPNLSIIVPIYNVEPYLPRCIESILEQTYTDFELILINDGSPDRCGDIIQEYAKKDKRIVIIHQKNRGVSAARNAGLRIAQGKYIGFVDPDDYIDKEFYQKMILEQHNTGTDIVCCNWDFVYEDGNVREHVMDNVVGIMCQEKFLRHMFDSPRTIGGSNCNKLFLRQKIKTFYDETLCICEDNLFLMKYGLQLRTASVIDEPLYHIFERGNSAMRLDVSKLIYGLPVREQMIQLAKNVSSSLKRLAEKDYLDSCYMLYLQLKNNNHQSTDIVQKKITEYMKKHFCSVMFNGEIFWKTRILYLVKYMELCFK